MYADDRSYNDYDYDTRSYELVLKKSAANVLPSTMHMYRPEPITWWPPNEPDRGCAYTTPAIEVLTRTKLMSCLVDIGSLDLSFNSMSYGSRKPGDMAKLCVAAAYDRFSTDQVEMYNWFYGAAEHVVAHIYVSKNISYIDPRAVVMFDGFLSQVDLTYMQLKYT